MQNSEIPIWFFIGILLIAYGAMILCSGTFEWVTGNYPPGVELTNLHAPVWWGALLTGLGIFYAVKFPPHRARK